MYTHGTQSHHHGKDQKHKIASVYILSSLIALKIFFTLPKNKKKYTHIFMETFRHVLRLVSEALRIDLLFLQPRLPESSTEHLTTALQSSLQ